MADVAGRGGGRYNQGGLKNTQAKEGRKRDRHRIIFGLDHFQKVYCLFLGAAASNVEIQKNMKVNSEIFN